MTEPTHGEILRAIGVLEGQLRQLVDAASTDLRERSSLGARVGRLETRMGQVVILAMVAALLAPIAWTEIRGLFRQPSASELRQ